MTKILIDKTRNGDIIPIGKNEINKALSAINEIDTSVIKEVHLQCNKKPSSVGEIRPRRGGRRISINIHHNDLKTKLFSIDLDNRYTTILNQFCEAIDKKHKIILWSENGIKKFALFMLFHEIGHLVHDSLFNQAKHYYRHSNKEEHWCDQFAYSKLEEIWPHLE